MRALKLAKEQPPGSDTDEKLAQHHRRYQWVYWSVILLGLWMALAPLTFDPALGTAVPAGGRELWLSHAARASLLRASDLLSGAALLFFGWRSLKPDRPISGWAICFIGIWLTFAPLLFWSPSAATYLNDTFVGAWLIGLSILVPGMPNMVKFMKKGAETPPGWSYNPSSWAQRSILIALGFAGWLVSRYLAAYQLGYVPSAWDPFFGPSSELVLTSKMSRGLPVSDAGLGSFAYTFEFLMGFMGSPSRWRTMPWMVTLFGVLVIPLGLVHIFLVISQPVAVGHWCTFCLAAAAIMLPMIPLEVDEVIAMSQFLRRAVRRGEPLWRAFFLGGADPEPARGGEDRRSPSLASAADSPLALVRASTWGMSAPWNLLAAAAAGLWLAFAPAALGLVKPLSDVAQVGGLLAITISVVAMGETIRLARLLGVVLGVAIAFASAPHWPLVVTGFAIASLSLPRGRIEERYGSWQKCVR